MKSNANILTTLRRIPSETGADMYTGTIDQSELKRIKDKKIEIVLMSADSIPPALASLMGTNLDPSALIVFAGPGGE